ncbi:MAG TPA: type 1 glutamine amidotransferase [Desulfobulbus sp.]|nr:type 1 glutamine amidotransferase [Desulfobulbus sp.]
MPVSFLVIQHADWETPGKLLTQTARQAGIKLEIAHIYRQSIPDPMAFDALLLLGGPPNVHEEKRYPFLKEEKQRLKAWLAMNKPCLGFCLGHQLLADCLGAAVGRNSQAIVGFTEGYLTHAGREHPIFNGISSPLSLFKWHAQAVQTPLPRDLVMLATSDHCVVEAFSVVDRPHIIGLQCDNHAAHPDDVRSWLSHDSKWIDSLPDSGQSFSDLPRQARQRYGTIKTDFAGIMNNFVNLVQNRRG